MKDKTLTSAVEAFRAGILQGRKSSLMCLAVCAPLEGYLRFAYGVETRAASGWIDGMEHFWLEMEDGRIIDPTADQFPKPNGDLMPAVYIGELPSWYAPDGDPADDEVWGD